MALEEKAIIVDEDDNVIEFVPRSKVNGRRIRMTAIWIEDSDGNVLIHKRSKQKSNWPGYWENAAAGGVAHDESYEENAYKELEEEIGVKGVELEFVAKTRFDTKNGERYCSWYKAVVNLPIEKFELQESEVEKVEWVKKQALLEDRDKNPDKYMPSSQMWRKLFA